MRWSWNIFAFWFGLSSVVITSGVLFIFLLKKNAARREEKQHALRRSALKWWLVLEVVAAVLWVGIVMWATNDPSAIREEVAAQRDAEHKEWNKQQIDRRKQIIQYAQGLIEEVKSGSVGQVDPYDVSVKRKGGSYEIRQGSKKVEGHPRVLRKPYPTITAIEEAIGKANEMQQPNVFVWKAKFYFFPTWTWEDRDRKPHMDIEKEYDALKVVLNSDGRSVDMITIYRLEMMDPAQPNLGTLFVEQVGRSTTDWSEEIHR